MEWTFSFVITPNPWANWYNFLFIAQGILITLKYSLISVFCGFIIAIILTIANSSKNPLISFVSKFYVSVFRGTPLLIQLSIIYFGIPTVFGFKFGIFISGVIAFSLNSGAYVSQIIQAGINAVDKGQFEAARSLGISNFHMMKDIIFPQAIRNILPALINEVVNMFKETAIISMLGEADIMKRAQLTASQTYDYFTPFFMAAGCYYVLVLIFSGIARYIEKKCTL